MISNATVDADASARLPAAMPRGFSATEHAGFYVAAPQVGLPIELLMFRLFDRDQAVPLDVACRLAHAAGEAKQAFRSRGLATFVDRNGELFCVPDDRDCHQVEVYRLMGGRQWIHPQVEHRPHAPDDIAHAWFPARMLHQLLSRYGDVRTYLEWSAGGVFRAENGTATRHPPEVLPTLAPSCAPAAVTEIVERVLAGDEDIGFGDVLDVLARFASGEDETRLFTRAPRRIWTISICSRLSSRPRCRTRAKRFVATFCVANHFGRFNPSK